MNNETSLKMELFNCVLRINEILEEFKKDNIEVDGSFYITKKGTSDHTHFTEDSVFEMRIKKMVKVLYKQRKGETPCLKT